MADFIQVVTAVDCREKARQISGVLIEEHLAACVQVLGPVESTYVWKGEVQRENEWLCLIKSRANVYSQLQSRIEDLHPYEEPEIIAVPILAGSRGYLEWIDAHVNGGSAES